MERTLSRRLLGKRTASRELLAFLDERLPRLQRPSSPPAWKRRATKARAAVLELFLRGHPAGVLEEQPRVEWRGVIDAGPGYRIRKLRYEGYPGLWVPALLYEPTGLQGQVPAVLNPNGHHAGGKAMDYKQARCINLAKRGMLALNTEFIGMGELRSDSDHMRISLLDFCGVAGVGVFYLLMKRGLDVLLAHRHADPERVAMTGLSGGGWQTAVLSALDERVTVPVPVAGHSPVWQRCRCAADMGDLEQCPADLCTAADYDVLTGMFAPRPTLLIYNHEDDCCFQTRRTRDSVFRPARAVFETLGAAGDIELHDNLDPGTHNYESDNRGQLYRFLNKHWGLDTPDDDLPYEEELLPESELNVGLPADNATLYSLAQGHLQRIRRRREKARPAPAAVTRRRLARVLNLGRYEAEGALGRRGPRGGLATSDGALRVGPWSVPVTAVEPGGRAKGTEIVLSDGGAAGRRPWRGRPWRSGAGCWPSISSAPGRTPAPFSTTCSWPAPESGPWASWPGSCWPWPNGRRGTTPASCTCAPRAGRRRSCACWRRPCSRGGFPGSSPAHRSTPWSGSWSGPLPTRRTRPCSASDCWRRSTCPIW